MTTFIRIIDAPNKESLLSMTIKGEVPTRIFQVNPQEFKLIPGSPFAYWVSARMRNIFERCEAFESGERTVSQGLATSDDFRFVRSWWEIVESNEIHRRWYTFAKGGAFSPFYADLDLVLNWGRDGEELKAWVTKRGNQHWSRRIVSSDRYFIPGLTYPRRLHRLAVMPLPAEAIISVRGSGIYGSRTDLYKIAGLFSSSTFDFLVKCMLGRFGHPQFDNGTLCKTPIPNGFPTAAASLESPTQRAITIKMLLSQVDELSHLFVLPGAIRIMSSRIDVASLGCELQQLQVEIDQKVFEMYGISEEDKAIIAKIGEEEAALEGGAEEVNEDEENTKVEAHIEEGLLSWCVGVAFGRFDLRLATGERDVPPLPDPFDPLPAKSPGMVPKGVAPYHPNPGILVDEPGHPHDLVDLIQDVLAVGDYLAEEDVRRWLRRDFFAHHLKQYSKSGRKAPIYWPLSTSSGDYTLWLYYPRLTDQTLYAAANDFVAPTIEATSSLIAALRSRIKLSADEERRLQRLEVLEIELLEVQTELLRLAPTWKPDHDDGVQITAAPLWRLFRHRPWQVVLKETWEKLEKGDYDWAHLAMSYWPHRVLEKCCTDKSLALAHGLEELYEAPPEKPNTGRRGRKRSREAS
jgi:hypothetical protein